jgi:hypothetical protein
MVRNSERMLQPEGPAVNQTTQVVMRRCYEAPSVDRHQVQLVVMGGSGRKLEQQPQQTHKHP